MTKKLSNKNQALLALGAAAAIGVFLYTRKKNKVAGIGGGIGGNIGVLVKTKEEENRRHEREFEEWKKKYPNDEFYDKLTDVLTTDIDLKRGDIVSFTNDYGVTFSPLKVLGFQKPNKWGRCVFLNTDAFWYPHKIEEIKKIV